MTSLSKQTCLLGILAFLILGPSARAQDFVLLDTLIKVDDLKVQTINYMDLVYSVSLRIRNISEKEILITGYRSGEESVSVLSQRDWRIGPGTTEQIRFNIPAKVFAPENREFFLETEARGNAHFRLKSILTRPIITQSPRGWTTIRETQTYPIKLEILNTQNQVLIIDSVIYNASWIDSVYRFKEWRLNRKLPLKIPPFQTVELRILIPTKGLYATIGSRFHLYHHWGEDSSRFMPIAHGFGVEPNIWVEEGGEWQVGQLRHGTIINRRMWITNESSLCLSLTSEDEKIAWCTVDTLCPGDTALAFVRYPTYCDTLGELDAEVALFITEFQGHVPLRFKGELYSDQELPAAYLMPTDSVFEYQSASHEMTLIDHTFQFVNTSSHFVLVKGFNASEYDKLVAAAGSRHWMANDPGTMRLASGDTLDIQYKFEFQNSYREDWKGYITVNYTLEGCPQNQKLAQVILRRY